MYTLLTMFFAFVAFTLKSIDKEKIFVNKKIEKN